MPRVPAPLTRRGRRRRGRSLTALAVVASFVVAPAGGCDDDSRRVPYIAPTLHNWSEPYRGHRGLVLHVFEVGRLVATGAPAAATGTRHVLAYVLEHPKQGLVVFDTGLNHAIASDGDNYLPAELTFALRVELRPGEDLPTQMRQARLDPARVRRVLLTNLRAPHAGEVAAFAHARVSVSEREREIARQAPLGYLAGEYDEVANWSLLGFDGAQPLGTMTAAVDVFGDGSVMALEAGGPTEGNLAFLLRLPERPVLLAGDAAANASALRHAVEPPAVRDRDAWWQTIWRIKRFAYLEPKLLAMPGYDPQAWRDGGLASVRVHEPVAAAETP